MVGVGYFFASCFHAFEGCVFFVRFVFQVLCRHLSVDEGDGAVGRSVLETWRDAPGCRGGGVWWFVCGSVGICFCGFSVFVCGVHVGSIAGAFLPWGFV